MPRPACGTCGCTAASRCCIPICQRWSRTPACVGLQPYVTTNGLLLDRRIDALVEAGLRQVTIGFYGTDAHYDAYVQRRDRFGALERSIAAVRERYGDAVSLRINWLLMRPSCNLEDLRCGALRSRAATACACRST